MKRLGWILFSLGVIYFIFLIRQDIINNLELKKEERNTIQKIEQEESYCVRLKNRSQDLKGNDLIEEIARTKLGMIKKGEVAYKVILD